MYEAFAIVIILLAPPQPGYSSWKQLTLSSPGGTDQPLCAHCPLAGGTGLLSEVENHISTQTPFSFAVAWTQTEVGVRDGERAEPGPDGKVCTIRAADVLPGSDHACST